MTSSCAEVGLVATAPGELTHQQPWSSAVVHDIRETDGTDGRVWFKANGIGTRYEDSGGLSVAASQALTARLPAYGQWCSDLAGSGIPSTIQHDDLHSNNICRPGSVGGWVSGPAAPRNHLTGPASAERMAAGPASGSRIIDWGDASIGHPFGTMLSTLGSIAHHNGGEVDDPRVQRVRDAYLEQFTTYAPRSELIRLVDVARRVGVVTRALSWQAALVESPTAVHLELHFPVRSWLQELLVPSP